MSSLYPPKMKMKRQFSRITNIKTDMSRENEADNSSKDGGQFVMIFMLFVEITFFFFTSNL